MSHEALSIDSRLINRLFCFIRFIYAFYSCLFVLRLTVEAEGPNSACSQCILFWGLLFHARSNMNTLPILMAAQTIADDILRFVVDF